MSRRFVHGTRLLALLATTSLLPLAASTTSTAHAAATTTTTLTGTITALDGLSVTLQTGGRQIGLIDALTKTADALAAEDLPYVWGGGHAVVGVASTGIKGGPGANGHRSGFDCSGTVAAVLAGAGLWPADTGVPSDAGVIHELLQAGLIAKGPGTTATSVTLYDHPGVHIFMNIDGRFFGTSDGGGSGNGKGGPSWLDDGAPDAQSRAFKQYHFLPSVLHDTTAYGHVFGFQTYGNSELVGAAAIGDKVRVVYREAGNGSMVLTGLTVIGGHTVATGPTGATGSTGSTGPTSTGSTTGSATGGVGAYGGSTAAGSGSGSGGVGMGTTGSGYYGGGGYYGGSGSYSSGGYSGSSSGGSYYGGGGYTSGGA